MATGISGLPAELIIRIIDFAHPSAHLNFARTCRFIFECSKDVLKLHRKAHDEYAVCSDVLPTTIPNLLRQCARDPIAAWNVRTLEFYWERDCWAKWEVCPFTIEKGTRVRGRGRPLSYALTQDERAVFLEMLREQLHFSEKDITKAREDLEGGSDAPLKLLLIALCPHLTVVKYSRDYHLSGREAFSRENEALQGFARSSLDYIQRAITSDPDSETWPAGLLSVRTLAIGVETGTEIDELSPESPFHFLLDLIALPNLTSVYFHGLSENAGIGGIDQDGKPYDIAENGSSVEHIYLDRPTLGSPREFRAALASAPKSLKSLTISGGEASDIDRWLSCNPGTFMLYETRHLNGYRCKLYRPDDLSKASRNLRTIMVDHEDLFLDEWDFRGYDCRPNCKKWAEPFQFFMECHRGQYIPSCIETIVLQKPSNRLSEAEADQIDDAILAILAQRSVYYRHCSNCKPKARNYFPNLKAIYLGALEDDCKYGSQEPRRKRWFQNSIRAGRKAGIDIHTRTTRGQPFHQIELPTPPNPAELRFIPDDVKEDVRELVELDVYTGRWTPQGCGNCGRCTACLGRYDPAIWEEIDRASAG